MNKEKDFARELAELINRHGIDAKLNTNDWILADMLVDTLSAYAKANALRDKMANRTDRPEGKRESRKPKAFDVPKEFTDMEELVAEFLPVAKVELHRIYVQQTRNKRKGGGNNETR